MRIIIILVFLITIAIIVLAITPHKQKDNYETNLRNFLTGKHANFSLVKSLQHSYDLDLDFNDLHFLIKLVFIPSCADVQVNSKSTWEIKYGAGDNPGKAQPFKKYLGSHIDEFMALKTPDNSIKVVVLIPKSRKIVMYINECEIIFVTPFTNVHGTRIINCDDFTLFEKYI